MTDIDAERLSELEKDVSSLDARLTSMEHVLNTHSAKLDRIVEAITATKARPQYDPQAIITFTKDVAILMALLGSLIVYIATGILDKPIAVMQSRVGNIEKRLLLDEMAKESRPAPDRPRLYWR